MKAYEVRIRDRAIVELRSSGMTMADIGTKYNISRQRVHQILRYKCNPITMTCPACKGSFTRDSKGKCCTTKCRVEDRRRKLKEWRMKRLGISAMLTCPTCGRTFTRGPQKIYCGDTCRDKARTIRQHNSYVRSRL